MMKIALDPYMFRRSRCPNGPAWMLTLFLLPHKRRYFCTAQKR